MKPGDAEAALGAAVRHPGQLERVQVVRGADAFDRGDQGPSGTRFILVMQERTSLPSRITEQQPHWPWPQPTLVPVSSNCSRKTSASLVSGSAMTVLGTPLTCSILLIICNLLFWLSAAGTTAR